MVKVTAASKNENETLIIMKWKYLWMQAEWSANESEIYDSNYSVFNGLFYCDLLLFALSMKWLEA